MTDDHHQATAAPARRGVYPAARASALSGVPESTLYLWARGADPLLVPSISSTRIKLWSWADLVALRAIYWLRHPGADDARRATTMSRVRDLIDEVEEAAAELGPTLADASLVLHVDLSGRVYLDRDTGLKLLRAWPQTVGRPLVIDLLEKFSVDESLKGPNLRRPRESLRIVPGKLSGEPHVEGTRIETRVLAALDRRGMAAATIRELYPQVSELALRDSLSLEEQLHEGATAA